MRPDEHGVSAAAESVADVETSVLFRLAEAVGGADEPHQVFEPALDAVTRALGVKRAAILLFDETGVMRFAASRGLSPEYRAAVEGHSPWARDTVRPPPIFVGDVGADATLAPFQALFRAERIGAIGFVPLYAGELLGKFMVYADAPRTFSQREAHLAEMIASQVAQGVTRARLLASERAARALAEAAHERTALLSEVSAILSSTLAYEENLRAVLELMHTRFADFCAVDLLDEGGLRRVSSRGASDRDARAETAEVIASKRPVVVPAIDGTSTIVAPIVARNLVLGVITLVRAHVYDEEDASLAELIGRRAGIAVDNARLFEAETAARRRAEGAERALTEANDRKNEFIAVLAHELRNPLAPILNAVEILRRRTPAGLGLERPREIIERQARHMSRMVDDLLDVSRITRRKMRLNLESLDFGHTVRVAVEDQREALDHARIDLHISLPAEPVWIVGDETRVAQIAGNLLHNAIKFTDPGGTITVQVTASDDSAELTVADTGMGMTGEVLGRIFEPFSQDDRTLARTRGGLGLGLALVKGLVDLHGGTVSAHSNGPGCGSRLSVVLPARRVECSVARPAAQPVTGPELRALIVEDNADAAEMLADLLQLLGHKAAVAPDGAQGVERARELRPDIILCDIGLPGEVDGFEVARRLRAEADLRGSYLVALTGYGQTDDRRRSKEAGFDLHLVKPIVPSDLEQALAAAVARVKVDAGA